MRSSLSSHDRDQLNRRAAAVKGTRLAVLTYPTGHTVRLSARVTRDGESIFGLQSFQPDQRLPYAWINLDIEKAQILLGALQGWLAGVL